MKTLASDILRIHKMALPSSFLEYLDLILQSIIIWITDSYIRIRNIFVSSAPDPFSLPPPFDTVSNKLPIKYVAPIDGYTIVATDILVTSVQVVNGTMYYVIPSSTLSTTVLNTQLLSLTEKASIGLPLNPWTPVLDSYFGKIIVTTAKYSVISGSVVMLNFDLLLKNIQNVTIDSSIAINLPILAKGADNFESAITAEVRYEDYDLGDFGASYMNGRVVAVGGRLIFYLYSFQPTMTYRFRGQINYRLEDNEII